jgi:uncharacterized protein YndB with AHSA1/START domain
MKQLNLTYTIHAPVADVWHALTDSATAEKWGAGPARVVAEEGGEFSYWDGDIHGINKKIILEKRLEQDWYGHDHPERKFNVVFNFERAGSDTIVTLEYSGNIENERRDIQDWKEYYFDPIKKLLEQ